MEQKCEGLAGRTAPESRMRENPGQTDTFRERWQYELYNRCAPVARQVVGRILCAVGSSEDVEELVQDVMWELLEHPEKYDESRGNLTTYTAVLSRSRALNARKKLLNSRTIPLEGILELGYEDNRAVEELELKELVSRILTSLKPREQKLFTMRFLYHMTIEDIAGQGGCSRRAVDIRLSRLRRKLERIFAAEGIILRSDGQVNDPKGGV